MFDITVPAVLRLIGGGMILLAATVPARACTSANRAIAMNSGGALRHGGNWTPCVAAPSGPTVQATAYGAVRVDYGMQSMSTRRSPVSGGNSMRNSIYDGRDAAVLRQRITVPLDELLLPDGPRPVPADNTPVPPPPGAGPGEDPFRDDVLPRDGEPMTAPVDEAGPPPTFADPPVDEDVFQGL